MIKAGFEKRLFTGFNNLKINIVLQIVNYIN